MQKVFIGVNFSPDFSYRALLANKSSPSYAVKENRDNIEEAGFGFTAGVTAASKINESIDWETGLQFASKGYGTSKQALFYPVPPTTEPVAARLIWNYRYLDVLMKIKFYWGSGRTRIVSSAGVSTGFLLNAKQTTLLEFTDGRTEKSRQEIIGFRKIDVSPMLAIGLNHRLNDNMQFAVEPTFRYGLLKIMDAPIAEHLWSAGLNLALYHSLGNNRNGSGKKSGKMGCPYVP